jgi:hypothetical protein
LIEGSSPVIRFNRIVNNEALNRTGVTSAGGGAMRCDGGTPRILNNVIMGNAGRYGGGIVLNYTGAIIRNNIIAANSGGEDYGGSGIWAYANFSAAKVVENNTIVNNTSVIDGGGVLVWSTSMTLRNNIIWGNSAPTGPNIRLRSGGSAAVSYSDVEGGWAGTGNLNAGPEFVDTTLILSPSSPCVDAGDSASVYNDPMDTTNPGNARWPSRGTVRNDMGAYGGPLANILGSVITAVGASPSLIPDGYRLDQNYPNPFNSTTIIRYALPRPERVVLKIYDSLGREIANPISGEQEAGQHSVSVDFSALPSGFYAYRLTTIGGFMGMGKLMYLR